MIHSWKIINVSFHSFFFYLFILFSSYCCRSTSARTYLVWIWIYSIVKPKTMEIFINAAFLHITILIVIIYSFGNKNKISRYVIFIIVYFGTIVKKIMADVHTYKEKKRKIFRYALMPRENKWKRSKMKRNYCHCRCCFCCCWRYFIFRVSFFSY